MIRTAQETESARIREQEKAAAQASPSVAAGDSPNGAPAPASAAPISICTDCGHIPHLNGCSALYTHPTSSAPASPDPSGTPLPAAGAGGAGIRPSDDQIIDAICQAFSVPRSKAVEWLMEMDFDGAFERMVEAA